MNSTLSISALVVLALAAAVGCPAQQQPATAPSASGAPVDPFAMDLNSLLETKVTTASKFPEKLSDAAGVVTVVTQDELQRFGGTTLLEVLARVPGLTQSSSFSADLSLITIRGDQTAATGGHILILINGRPVRENLGGGVISDILESFPIGILERIEVVKGPGSVLYGSDAFSGVINLITKKAEGKEMRASGSEGAAGERSGTENILFQQGALNIVEGGQYHNWPRWDITERAVGVSGAVTAQNAVLRDDGTGAYMGLNFKGLSFMTSYTEQEAPSFIRGIVGDSRLKRGFGDLGYAIQASPKWKMTFNATYTRSIFDAPDYPVIHRDSYEGDLEWTNFVTFSENDRLTFGTVYNHIDGTETSDVPPFLPDAQGSRNAGEVYAQFEHRLNDSVKLIGGVQASKIGSIALNAVPRGGVIWNPSGHLTAKLLYGGAYNAPSLDALLVHHPGLVGNPNLVPEKVGTLDAQVSYQTNRVQVSLDYYYSQQSALIIQDGATFPTHYYNDPTPVHFQGGELEGKFYLKRDWFLTGSALYEIDDSGSGASDLSPTPNALLKGGLSYRSANGADISLFDAWQGGVTGFQPTLNPPPAAYQSIGAHARYDLSKHWLKTGGQGFALFLNAGDLLNHPVWLPALGSGGVNTLPVIRGRTVFFGIEVWQKQLK